MNSATNLNDLAREFLDFQKLNKEDLDMKDHVQLYEALTNKIEKAGITYYDLSVYAKHITLVD